MSVYGAWLAATIVSGTATSVEVDLGRDYDVLEVQIPTLSSSGTLKLTVAEKTGGPFGDLGNSITTTSGVHNYNDVWELGGWQFIKVVASVSQTPEVKIRVRGMRY